MDLNKPLTMLKSLIVKTLWDHFMINFNHVLIILSVHVETVIQTFKLSTLLYNLLRN